MLAVSVALLLAVLLSPGVATRFVKVGDVPTAAANGVIGTVKVVLAALASGPGLEQATLVPVVEQLKPLLVNVAGAVTLAGIVSVVVIGPVVGALPMLLTPTGSELVCPATRAGLGWLIDVVRSGCPPTGTVVVPVLLVVLISDVVATTLVKLSVVLAVAAPGVIGTENVMLLPLAMGPALVQDTLVPVVVQPKPLLVNVAGAVTLAGIVSVVMIGPVVGAEPMLLTVTGRLLG